jgi:hypothetical protein
MTRICVAPSAVSIIAAAIALLVAFPAASGCVHDPGLTAAAAVVSARLDPRVAPTMALIPDTGRRILALRSYLRAGATLPARWSWSDQEIQAFEHSQEFRDAEGELDRVVAAFATAYPGYTLYINRQVRSLDLQLHRWNSNASVGDAAQGLLADLARAAKARCSQTGADWLKGWLIASTLPVPVTLAAPGLSAHGQSRAFDFQVEHQGELVAGTETARAAQDWDAAGWTERLRRVVTSTSTRFHGPLEAPREPWHYVYSSEPSSKPPGGP